MVAASPYKAQAAVLAEVKAFHPSSLRHVNTVRCTQLDGSVVLERWQGLQTHTDRSAEEEAALAAIATLRLRAKKDALPTCVAPGLFIGGAAAARNLKALRKRGITHVVNAAPCVPCHFRDNPEGFQYWTVPLFDDPDADLLAHVDAANAFIDSALLSGGGVLVHCYAGQSRSAALVMAYLMARQGLGLMDAWAATRAARPCAQPNSGFLRQLATYAKRVARSRAEGACSLAASPSDSECDVLLTQ